MDVRSRPQRGRSEPESSSRISPAGRSAEAEPIERFRYVADGWGDGELYVQGDVVLSHDLVRSRGDSHEAATAEPPEAVAGFADQARGPAPHIGGSRPPTITLARTDQHVATEFVSTLLARIQSQLRGGATRFDDVPLDLSWCTPFQASLAAVLRAVPWGEVVTYGELAALAGRPGAARAAGTFCAQNRFWLFVPCHRVVAAGGIGGYGDVGVGFKRRLLALEGVEL
jgi:methylated-DNA-[protein]-cysteine S-methyltransferase